MPDHDEVTFLEEPPGMMRRLADRPEAGYALAFSWFPPEEWPRATERWPDLLDERPADPLEYSHVIESIAKQYRIHASGNTFAVAPMTVEGLVAYAAEKELDPATGDARAAYAADLLRRGEAAPWPPGRNDPCWCRSGHKYKRCCGPVPPKAFADPSGDAPGDELEDGPDPDGG